MTKKAKFVLSFLNYLVILVEIASAQYRGGPYSSSCLDTADPSDIIQIKVNDKTDPFYVKCDNDFEGGGWTVVLNRYNGSVNFSRKWDDCVYGFGNINEEFFIGLQRLHEITASTLHELAFKMSDFDGNVAVAHYQVFAIEGARNAYAINVLGNYSGNAGDSFMYHAGQKFSTQDKDSSNGCPDQRASPGWFDYCSRSNIFGQYLTGKYEDVGAVRFRGLYWSSYRGKHYSLKELKMLIRPNS